jgi:hypothetical protein
MENENIKLQILKNFTVSPLIVRFVDVQRRTVSKYFLLTKRFEQNLHDTFYAPTQKLFHFEDEAPASELLTIEQARQTAQSYVV